MEKITIDLKAGESVYFASDMHLGSGGFLRTREKEKLLLRWMDRIRPDCGALVLCGDVFDFWYEWKKVVPKGYVRLLGKLAQWTDEGIPVYFFSGNHDMWAKDYFARELGVEMFHEPREFDISGKRFFVGHGDGLGPKDHRFKMMKAVFKNPVARWLFSHLLHPDFAMRTADYFSRRSRAATGCSQNTYLATRTSGCTSSASIRSRNSITTISSSDTATCPSTSRLRVGRGTSTWATGSRSTPTGSGTGRSLF